MQQYEQMLDGLYAALPKRERKDVRFEVPPADVMTVGTKTTVKNFDAICAYVRRQPAQVAKYLFNELAAPGAVEEPRLVLQGKFSARAVNERLQSYVKLFVLCKECGKPDTNLVQIERNVYAMHCEACGAKSPVRA